MKYTPPVLAYYFLRSLPALGIVDAAKLVVAGISDRTFSLSAPGWNTTVLVRGKTSDLILFFILFIKREIPPMPSGVGFIVDAGANVGFMTKIYACAYPDARIIAVEPDPANFQALLSNCSSLKNVQCLHAAVWTSDAKRMSMTGSDSWSLQVCEADSGSGIPSVTMASLLKMKNGPGETLVKMDIEGAERPVFEDSSEWVQSVKHIHVEIHDCWRSIFNALTSFRYDARLVGEYLCFTFEHERLP